MDEAGEEQETDQEGSEEAGVADAERGAAGNTMARAAVLWQHTRLRCLSASKAFLF
jgi:hypothetical protein